MNGSVANYVIVYPPFPFPKLRVPKTEKKLKRIAASVQVKLEKIISEGKIISRLDADAGTLAAILTKGIEAIIHSGKTTGKEMYNLERVKKGVFDYMNLLFVFTKDC